MQKRRVVITGMGAVSPFGLGLETLWQALKAGRSGIRPIAAYDASDLTTRFAGEVPPFDVSTVGITAPEARRMDPFIHYGLAACVEAIQNADLKSDTYNPVRCGIVLGSGIGGLHTIETMVDTLQKQGVRRVSPFFIPSVLINLLAGHAAIRFQMQGPNLAVSTACTTGTHAVGLAARLIAWGDADLMLAGGAEHGSCHLSVVGFQALRALSTRNEDPAAASRPFDEHRDGFVIGDGAGALILEEREHALARGAPILAEITGFGMSCDAYHITQPTQTGCIQAMQHALAEAQLPPSAIGYVNAHATSTPLGDRNESEAIETVWGPHAKNLLVSSTKSMTGHLLGAAGALESIISVLALQHQCVPPTINLERPGEGCRLNYVPHQAVSATLEHVLSNSFGFGGTNGSLIFSLPT